jgi:RHH-type proline utilization regulon transcriptional repressor/proline dehydrogenase/delta 1-pyrroline-5-carboxylate dehydrogenase
MTNGEPLDVEARTLAFGQAVFARIPRQAPIIFTPAWFDDQLMGWTMADHAVKIQLFRFIDALPLLKTPAQITRHLQEYFAEAGSRLPGWMRWGLKLMPERGVAGRALAWASHTNARRLARRFIAGATVQEALEAITRLRRRQFAFTIDLLGEATITEVEAAHYQAQYLELIEGLGRAASHWPVVDLIDRDHRGPIPPVNVSVKLSSLFSQFDAIDPEGTSLAVRDRLRPILRLARRYGAFVNFDMEQFAFKDVTLRIFREILSEPEFVDWPDVGIAIQAYLLDCERDLVQLRDWAASRGTGVWIRLVKGAYWDFETVIAAQNDWPVPVFTDKRETDSNYERLTRFLMKNHEVLRPAFGSHNVRSIAHALSCAENYRVPQGAYEFQALYGMADPIKEALVGMGHRVRVYTPYGQLLPGMAYLVRRLLENTSNESFLRASFADQKPEEQLLMNPANKPGAHPHDQKSDKVGDTFRNEPISDFSREANRSAMVSALTLVQGQLGRDYPLIVDGNTKTTGHWIESRNPSHWDQIVGRCAAATAGDAEEAIRAARAAFPSWRDTPVEARADFLFKAAHEMRRRRFELSAWAVIECGKPWREADADIAEAIDFCDFYGREMKRLAVPRRRDVLGEHNEQIYEPRGVAVVIAPWNFPLAILCGMTTAALVAGNTVIMKPAEQSCVMGAKLMEIFNAVRFPTGVVQYLPGVGEEVGPILVNHRDVDVITFTGSRGVGLAINRQAAETPKGQSHVKRVIAEMGGKNAIIVDDDADLDEAVRGVADSAFVYSGQKCSACSRVIVLDSLYETFLNRLVEEAKSRKISHADDPGCSVGPVIDREAQQRILAAIEKGKAEAKLVWSSDAGSLAQSGCFVGPHIFADVSPSSFLGQEEIFGPVLAVMRAKDLTHALDIANGTDYALTGGFFSRSPENIRRVRREFRVGNLYINRKITGALVDRQPFGGFKLSGIGSKAGGSDYLLQFLLPRCVTENTMRHGFTPESD